MATAGPTDRLDSSMTVPAMHVHKEVLDHLSTAVILLDHKLRVQYLNAAAEGLFEISGRRARGKPVASVFCELDENAEELRNVAQTGRMFTKREARFEVAGGETLTVDYSVTPITSGRRFNLLLEIHPRDRLMRINREETLLAKHQAGQELIRGLAHEVKNPLGGVRGAAQLLESELDSDELREYTQVIIDEADRLRNLVDRMLGSHQPPQMTRVNVHEILQRVARLIGVESEGRIRIERDYDPSLPDLEGDPERLIQAFLNILRNAMQSLLENEIEADPRITLRTRAALRHTIGGKVHKLLYCIEISDNGPGIPDEIQQNLFYPMISGRAEGTGLGLSISQSIVQLHQGLIECESEPGKTIFRIYLPLEQSCGE